MTELAVNKNKFARMPIQGLHESAAALDAGGVYILFCQEHSKSWVNRLLYLMSKQSSWMIIAKNPEHFFSDKSIANNIFRLTTLTYKAIRWLLKELLYYKMNSTKVIVLQLNASDWFSNNIKDNQNWCQKLRNWAEEQHVAVILVMFNDVDSSLFEQTLQKVQIQLSGFASIVGNCEPVRWSIRHWFNKSQIIANEAYYLIHNKNELVAKYINPVDIDVDNKAIIMDIDRVVIMVDAIREYEDLPANWEMTQNFKAIENGQDPMHAGYLIMAFTGSTTLDFIKKVLHLRQQLGPLVKIVIREINTKMRHADERILLHFGASLVIPENIMFSRFIGMLETIRELTFIRHIEGNLDKELEIIMSHKWRGLLTIENYYLALKELEDLSLRFGVSVSLIELTLNSGLTIKNTVALANFKRSGDIYIIINNKIYICLFGCRNNDISQTLKYIFGIENHHFFQKQKRYITFEQFLTTLKSVSMSENNSTEISDASSEQLIDVISQKSIVENHGPSWPKVSEPIVIAEDYFNVSSGKTVK